MRIPYLTRREFEVLQRICLPIEITAQELGISDNTLKIHRAKIFSKLNVNNRAEAVITALKYHLIELYDFIL